MIEDITFSSEVTADERDVSMTVITTATTTSNRRLLLRLPGWLAGLPQVPRSGSRYPRV
jgi:hypothetical protein